MSIDQEKEKYIDQCIESYVMPRLFDPNSAKIAAEFFRTSNFREHRIRFIETFDRINKHLTLQGRQIAETGHLSGVSQYISTLGTRVEQLDGDFRYQIDAADNCYDIVFSFEVLEHIKDHDSQRLDDIVLFNFSGVKRYISEIGRILKPRGQLVLTTPNAASLKTVARAMSYGEPWLFFPHVKEYAPSTVIKLCHECGFKVETMETMFTCFYLDASREIMLKKIFTDIGYSADHRGDDAFYIFRKPG